MKKFKLLLWVVPVVLLITALWGQFLPLNQKMYPKVVPSNIDLSSIKQVLFTSKYRWFSDAKGLWQVEWNGEIYQGDKAKIEQFLVEIESIRRLETVSRDQYVLGDLFPENWTTKLNFLDAEGKSLWIFILGKPSEDTLSRFSMLGGTSEVFLVERALIRSLEFDGDYWTDLRLLPNFEPQSIQTWEQISIFESNKKKWLPQKYYRGLVQGTPRWINKEGLWSKDGDQILFNLKKIQAVGRVQKEVKSWTPLFRWTSLNGTSWTVDVGPLEQDRYSLRTSAGNWWVQPWIIEGLIPSFIDP